MTLNVTLLTPDRIYQSSDFRLVDLTTGRTLTNAANKAVHLSYETFYGMLTYTGIASDASRSTIEHLMDWLAVIGECSLSELAEELAEHASGWLRTFGRPTGEALPLTIVIAAFDRGVPTAQVISNFETVVDQRARSARDATMTVSEKRGDARPFVLVTGWRDAVARAQRRRLARTAARFSDRPQRIRQAMVALNSEAASSSQAQEMISPECSVISMNRNGTGAHTLTEPHTINVRMVSGGKALPGLAEIAKQFGGAELRLVQAGLATSAGQAYAQETMPCTAPIVNTDGAYSLQELRLASQKGAIARDLNDAGTVLGASTFSSAPGGNRLWTWTSDSGCAEIGVAVTNSAAMAINGSGHVAGAMSDGPTDLYPYVLSGHSLHALEHEGSGGGVNALSRNGTAVGWISLSLAAAGRGQLDYRPAIWLADRKLIALHDLPAEWGVAVDVNIHGVALVWLHHGMFKPAIATWSIEGGLVAVTDERKGVVPVGLDDYGRVVGFGYDSEHRAVTIRTNATGDIEPLGLEPGWLPTATNGTSWIAGEIARPGNGEPWIQAPDGDITLLPRLADHHCRPYAINTSGDVVGIASADHGSHALLWKRNRQ